MTNYTLRDVSNIADGDTMELLYAVFPHHHIPDWFYRPNAALENETPADLCFEGRDGTLRDYLLKHGIDRLARKYQWKDQSN